MGARGFGARASLCPGVPRRVGEEEDGFLMTFVWDAGTKTSFLVVHDARALELVAEVDVEGALRVPRGVVGGGRDAEDTGGSGGGGGWYLKFVSLFICNHHHASHVCQKSQEGWGERRVCLCVSLFHSRFCWLEVGLVFGLSELCGGVPSSGSCPSLLYECRERAWKGGDENQKQKEKSCGFRGCSACSCPL